MSNAKLKRDLLRGPLAKIERAQKHINDLNEQITDYLSGAPFELRVRQTDNPPQRLIYVEAKKAIPDELPLIVGDAAHNLRTALDHLCFAMVGTKATRLDGVGFPFAKSANGFESAIATRQMHLAPKHVIDELKALKPYPGGNKALHAVKAIDERDKHHFIITVGLGTEMTFDHLQTLIAPNPIGHNIPPSTRIAATGDFIVNLAAQSPIKTFDERAEIQPTFTVGFAQGETLESTPVLLGLREMAFATEDAVRRLAAAYFR